MDPVARFLLFLAAEAAEARLRLGATFLVEAVVVVVVVASEGNGMVAALGLGMTMLEAIFSRISCSKPPDVRSSETKLSTESASSPMGLGTCSSLERRPESRSPSTDVRSLEATLPPRYQAKIPSLGFADDSMTGVVVACVVVHMVMFGVVMVELDESE